MRTVLRGNVRKGQIDRQTDRKGGRKDKREERRGGGRQRKTGGKKERGSDEGRKGGEREGCVRDNSIEGQNKKMR